MVKKRLNFCALALVICMAISCMLLSGCNFKNREVAGTYNMTSCSGSINGTTITEENYEYFTMILEINGKGTVKAKGKGNGTPSYEASGIYTYEDGKIKLTSQNSGVTVTEEYDYADGVITYSFNQGSVNFTITLTRDDVEQKS